MEFVNLQFENSEFKTSKFEHLEFENSEFENWLDIVILMKTKSSVEVKLKN